MHLEPWDRSRGPLSEQAMREWLGKQGYSVARFIYPPGTYFAEHTHAVDKKDGVLRGRLRIRAGGKSYITGAR